MTTMRSRFLAAAEAALAARVPDSDRNGPGRDLVHVTGYYEVPTVSCRVAWAHYAWRRGRCVETHCTYDPSAERTVRDLIVEGADPAWAEVQS